LAIGAAGRVGTAMLVGRSVADAALKSKFDKEDKQSKLTDEKKKALRTL